MAARAVESPPVRVQGFFQGLRRAKKAREPMGPLARNRQRWFYLMISPWLLGFVVLQAGAILIAIGLSFADYTYDAITWVGLTHYQTMLQDPLVTKALLNTFYYAAVSVPLGLLVAFVLATLLNQKLRGVNIFRTIFFMPSVIQGVAVIMLWGWIFNPNLGIVNALLRQLFDIKGPAWLFDKNWAMLTMILQSLWGIGWIMLIYLAGLQDIPQELYESAELDGANWWAKLRYIIVPLISPVTFFLLVTSLISALQIFTPMYILTRGGPFNSTMTLALLVYLSAFEYAKLNYAVAIALVLFVIIMLLTLFQFRVSRRWVYYGSEPD